RYPGVTGLIVGDGLMREGWQRYARERGVADVVRFAGQVPYAEVPAWLSAMDVVAAPFTADRGETSPFKVLDAMACARPVVASDHRPRPASLAAAPGEQRRREGKDRGGVDRAKSPFGERGGRRADRGRQRLDRPHAGDPGARVPGPRAEAQAVLAARARSRRA